MANTQLEISVEVSEKDAFHVFEATGSYDKKKNPKGWGGKNSNINHVTSSLISVLPPDSTSPLFVDVYPSFPTDKCIGYEIIPADMGLSTFYPGIYQFHYSLTLSNGYILETSCTFFHSEPLECCIAKKKAQTDLKDASSDLAKKVIELEALLINAKHAACLGNMDCVKKITDYIWTQCGCCC